MSISATEPSTRSRRRASVAPTRDTRMLERADHVLWSLAPPGIVLHNFKRRQFLELDAIGYLAWGYLDGARTVDEVVERCCESIADQPHARAAAAKRLRDVVDMLASHGFIEERSE